MKRKVFFTGICAVVIATAAIFVSIHNEKIGQVALLMQNVEALTSGEVIPGKICYYKGTTDYVDRIPCTADYPNIGKCGARIVAFYSTQTAQCYE